MSKIEFTAPEQQAIVKRIQQYFADELDQEIGQFAAEFLLAFFAEEIGPAFYNRGLLDAQAVLTAKLENIAEAVDELEKPTQFLR